MPVYQGVDVIASGEERARPGARRLRAGRGRRRLLRRKRRGRARPRPVIRACGSSNKRTVAGLRRAMPARSTHAGASWCSSTPTTKRGRSGCDESRKPRRRSTRSSCIAVRCECTRTAPRLVWFADPLRRTVRQPARTVPVRHLRGPDEPLSRSWRLCRGPVVRREPRARAPPRARGRGRPVEHRGGRRVVGRALLERRPIFVRPGEIRNRRGCCSNGTATSWHREGCGVHAVRGPGRERARVGRRGEAVRALCCSF